MVWFSTPKSLENNEVSFLAIVEIILAIGIYWGIAVYFDVYWHIVSSIFFAPLFLLQSPESINFGLKKFIKSTKDKRSINDVILKGKSVIIRFMFIFIIGLIVKIFSEATYSFILLISISFVIHIIVDDIFNGLYSTISSIIKFFKYGYKNISFNWFHNSLSIDFKQVPELVSGIEKSNLDDYKISFMIKQLFIVKWVDKISIFLVLVIIFPFTIFYRLSIKSTFWFYIPLLFVVKKPNLETSQQIGKFLSELYETTWVKVRGFLALLTVGAFIVTHFNYFSFDSVDSPFGSILSLIYLDFSSLAMWKIFQLLVAIITIGLFFYANAIRVPCISNDIPLQKDIHIKIIYYLNSIRNWFSLCYLLSAFIFLSVHLKIWEYKYAPNFLSSFFTTLLEYTQYVPFS